jgi:capsular polysaccharide biosynthesis protein
MDVTDIVRRVGLAYWPMIIGLALLGAGAGAALHYGDPPVYTSDVRFVLDAPDPQAMSESTAIADTAKSIATSPSHISAALALAGVKRDITRFAMQNIELQPLGTSGVMDLQVKDTDPNAAAIIANALAADIIDTRAKVERTQAQYLLDTLGDEISATNDSIARVDAEIAAFRPSADPSVSAATLSGLYSERASLAQERTTLETEQYQVSQYLATRPQAGIIEPAFPAAQPDPSRAPIDMALGGIGGLVLAVLLASVLAVLRPRLRGVHQIEQAFEAPVLGDFDPADEDVDSVIGARLRIAATRSGLKQLQLAAVDGLPGARTLIGILASRLETPTLSHGVPVPLNGNGQAIVRPKRKAPQSTVSVIRFDMSDFSRNGAAADTGLVLVTPDVLRGRDLESAAYLTSLTGWPVVGVVTYSKRALASIGLHRRRAALIPLTSEHDDVDTFSFRAGLK